MAVAGPRAALPTIDVPTIDVDIKDDKGYPHRMTRARIVMAPVRRRH